MESDIQTQMTRRLIGFMGVADVVFRPTKTPDDPTDKRKNQMYVKVSNRRTKYIVGNRKRL